MKLRRDGFTLLELVFVIVVLAIISKFGVEFLAQAYRNYLDQEVTSRLANTSSSAVEYIAKKLQYRIRSSVIVRKDLSDYKALEGFNLTGANAEEYKTLEWIGYDIEGFRGAGDGEPYWSGVIDKKASLDSNTYIFTKGSNLNKVNLLIKKLSYNHSTIDDAAIYIFSAQNDIYKSFGWYGGEKIKDQTLEYAMHPVKEQNTTAFAPGPDSDGNPTTFSDLFTDVKDRGEWDARYYLAWTAYAVKLDAATKKLILYYDFQPWQGEKYTDGKQQTLMENVNTFKMIQKQGIIKIQVCTTSDVNGTGKLDIGGFALCKEKTIY